MASPAGHPAAFTPRIHLLNEQAALLELGWVADSESARRVAVVVQRLAAAAWPGVLDIIPAYVTVLVQFDPLQIAPPEMQARLSGLCVSLAGAQPQTGQTVEVPVCYGGDYGPDLLDVARFHDITPKQVIELHASVLYEVRFIGFSPGFPYLAGLPAGLVTPRLPTPRTHTPAGSVGIGGDHTGIYPSDTPGGWRIIGRTPLKLYDPAAQQPILLHAGDRIRFTPVAPAHGSR